MSTAHASEVAHQHEEVARASTRVYLEIAAILTVLTVLEIWAFYVPALQSVLIPILLVLSGAKFVLVVMFYMHLKFDHRAYTAIFTPLLALGAFIVIALMIVLAYFLGAPPTA
jgi:cytochrome c oxidase subunit 4